MGNDKIKLSPTIAGYSKCSHKTRATVISFIYWVISGIILISPCLSIAYVVLDKDEQFYEAVLDENTSLEFRQKYITFFTSLYNADKSGILITNDWPLINRFIYGSWTYLFAIYWIIQVVLCAKLMQGVEQENFWKMNAWYEGQMGILMASSVASFSVLGSRIISPELFYVLVLIAVTTTLLNCWLIYTVFRFMQQVGAKNDDKQKVKPFTLADKY